MKATIEIPDALYRQLKAKSALRGLAVREVAVGLFQRWVSETDEPAHGAPTETHDVQPPVWFAAARPYAGPAQRHDMTSIHRSVARGRTGFKANASARVQERT